MTERDITSRIDHLLTPDVWMANVYWNSHESDALAVTRADLVHEFEVKLTVSDFKADLSGEELSVKWARQQVLTAALKKHRIYGWSYKPPRYQATEVVAHTTQESWESTYAEYRRAYRIYAQPAPACPSYFTYIYPVHLAGQLDELVPAFAGIAHADTTRRGRFLAWVRKPPRLHADKDVGRQARQELLEKAYHRYHEERRLAIDLQRRLVDLQQRAAVAA